MDLTLNTTFVDDNLLVNQCSNIMQSIHCNIYSLSIIFGFPEEKMHQLCTALSKLTNKFLSHLQEQLDFLTQGE